MPLLCIMIQPRQGVYGEYGQSGWVVWCGDGSYALVWECGWLDAGTTGSRVGGVCGVTRSQR